MFHFSNKKLLFLILPPYSLSAAHEFQNGKKEYDGNPIFNAYIPEINRAIRIIQVSPKEEGADISAWIDDIELNGKSKRKTTKELVLDIKLSKKAKYTATELMKAWIQKQLSASI